MLREVGHRGATGWRRVRRPAAPGQRRRSGSRPRGACSRRSSSRSWSTAIRWRSAAASASRSFPSTAPTRARCCAAPTWPCTWPSANQSELSVYTARARPAQSGSPVAGRRAARRDRAGPAGAVLPAQSGHRRAAASQRRSARALAASAARAGAAGRVHSPRRAVGPGPRAQPLGAARRLAPGPRVAPAGARWRVAVNLSMRDLQDPALPETVAALLRRWGVRPALLSLEITESTLMADPGAGHGDRPPPERDGRAHRHRRLRHRLLVAGVPEAPGGATS